MLVKLFVICLLAFSSHVNAQEQTSKSTRNSIKLLQHQRPYINPVFPYITPRRHPQPDLHPETTNYLPKSSSGQPRPRNNTVVTKPQNSVDRKLSSRVSERRDLLDRRGISTSDSEVLKNNGNIASTAEMKDLEVGLDTSPNEDAKKSLSENNIKQNEITTQMNHSAEPSKSKIQSPSDLVTSATTTIASATPEQNIPIVFNENSFPQEILNDKKKEKIFDDGYLQQGLFSAMNRPRPSSPDRMTMEKDIMPKALKLGKGLDSGVIGAFVRLPPPSNENSSGNRESKISGPNPGNLHSTYGVASRDEGKSENRNFRSFAGVPLEKKIQHRPINQRAPNYHTNSRIASRESDHSIISHNQGTKIDLRFPSFEEPPQIIHKFQPDHNAEFNRQVPVIQPDSPVGSVVGHSIFVNSDQDMPSSKRNIQRGRLDKGEGPIIIQRGDPAVDKPVLFHLDDQLQGRSEQGFLNFDQELARRDQQFLNTNQELTRRRQQFQNENPSRLIDDKFGPAFTVIHGGPGQPDVYIPEPSDKDRRPRPDKRPLNGPDTKAKPDVSFTFQPNRLPSFISPSRPLSTIIPHQFHESFKPTHDQSQGFNSFGKPLPSFIQKPIKPSTDSSGQDISSQSPDLNPFQAFSFFPNLEQASSRPSHLQPKEKPKLPSQYQGSEEPSTFSNFAPPQSPPPEDSEEPKPVTYRPHATNQVQNYPATADSGIIFSQTSKTPRPRFPPSTQTRPTLFSTDRDRLRPIRDEIRPNLLNEVEREYAYGYEVNAPSTGDYKTAHEVKGRDGVVRGHYSLVQPDGLIRLVTYQADEVNGFRANVEFLPAYLR